MCKSNDSGYPTSARPQLDYQVGRALHEQGDHRGAIPPLLRVTAASGEIEPWLKPWAHFRLGSCFQVLGDERLTRYHFEKAEAYDDTALRLRIERERVR